MMPLRASMPRPRGLTLIELTVALAVLACAFVAIFDVLYVMGNGMRQEAVRSDLQTQTQGRLYDMAAELREAAAYSPNFSIKSGVSTPPSITFDLVTGVDAKGSIVWGNKITYRLVLAPPAYAARFAYLKLVPAQILRDESGAMTPLTTTVIEDLVPWQFTENGVTKWGFNVSRDGNALSLAVSRFGELETKNGNTSSILTASGVYYLRNPQVVSTLR